MQPVTPKWLQSGLVLVCERCFKERIPDEDPEVAAEIGDFNLRDWLKAEFKEHGAWGPIRVVSTSCMDVCAKGRVTVCIDPKNGDPPEVFVADPVREKHAVYERIVATLLQKRS
jgi:predicted metal-binding protein